MSARVRWRIIACFARQVDAYFVHPSGDWVAFIDNDSHITVTTKTAKIGADINESLETWMRTAEQPLPPRLF
jgi:hypothetical protein